MSQVPQKKNGQWDTKTKYRAVKKSRKQILREKRDRMRRKRSRVRILKHGIGSLEIQMGRAVAKLKKEMEKEKPIESRVWNLAYSAFVDANMILNQVDRMMRIERKKAKARLFLANLRKTEVELPKEEKKIETVINYCDRCNTVWCSDVSELCNCKRKKR